MDCAGLTTEPPAPIILCSDCLIDTLEPRKLPLSSEEEEFKRRRVLRGLTKAYQQLLRHVKRAATKKSYADGLKAFRNFGEALQLDVLPCHDTRFLLVAYTMYALCWKNLDSSTIDHHLAAVGDFHDYVRSVFQKAYPNTAINMNNPMHTPELREMLETLTSNYKKKSKARQPVTITQAREMFRLGFPDTPSGRHHRLAVMFSLLGMLRQRAATLLIVRYNLRATKGGLQVEFLPDSDVWVEHIEGNPAIVISVEVDKNVNALKRRKAYIPHVVHALNLEPVNMLLNYLRDARPPSGGFLLAAPLSSKKSHFQTHQIHQSCRSIQESIPTGLSH